MWILGSVESIGAVQETHITVTVRGVYLHLFRATDCICLSHSHSSIKCEGVDGRRRRSNNMSVSECVLLLRARLMSACKAETGLWCNQQLPQRHNMQSTGVKEERRRAGGQDHCHDMACCDSYSQPPLLMVCEMSVYILSHHEPTMVLNNYVASMRHVLILVALMAGS